MLKIYIFGSRTFAATFVFKNDAESQKKNSGPLPVPQIDGGQPTPTKQTPNKHQPNKKRT